jgi:Zn-dependent peptidase ImmA (M78 family)
VEQLLRAAEVNRRLPTPIDDIVAAAGLVRGSDEIFSPSIIARAPKELRVAVAKLTGRVWAMLDRREREIYINPEITIEGRRNFQTLHEVGHDILPWQTELAYADDAARLSWRTKIRFEREANATAGELLFQRTLLSEIGSSYAIRIATVIELAEMFGASIHSTFRRYIETHRGALAGVVLDSKPWRTEPCAYKRHETPSSASWGERFASPTNWPQSMSETAFPFLTDASRAIFLGTFSTTWSTTDLAGAAVELNVELFSNTYNTLILVSAPQSERGKRKRRLVPTS